VTARMLEHEAVVNPLLEEGTPHKRPTEITSSMPKWWPKRKKDPAVTDAPSLAQTAAMDLFSSRGDDYAQNGDYN
jgi:hypothetical protein